MNMTDDDKELALRIAGEVKFGYWPLDKQIDEIALAEFSHRYHTAKLEQAASGFEEWCESKDWPKTEVRREAFQAGAAIQQAKIAALTEEIASLKDQLGQAQDYIFQLTNNDTGELPTALCEVAALTEEVGRLKVRCYLLSRSRDGWEIQANEFQKQLQSAQLDNKRLREVFGNNIGANSTFKVGEQWIRSSVDGDRQIEDPGEISVLEALSTPLDTSTADELLARVKEQEECIQGWVKCNLEGWIKELREEAKEAVSYKQQLTAARSALVEAREALKGQGILLTSAMSLIPGQSITFGGDYPYPDATEVIATINSALGEEQKKKEGVK